MCFSNRARSGGNPPKGFLSSKIICCDVYIVNHKYKAFLNVNIYKIPPQRRYPDRPPLMVKGVLYL